MTKLIFRDNLVEIPLHNVQLQIEIENVDIKVSEVMDRVQKRILVYLQDISLSLESIHVSDIDLTENCATVVVVFEITDQEKSFSEIRTLDKKISAGVYDGSLTDY